MPPRNYCGTKQVLPDGYNDFADRYSCLRKGYGIAKYNCENGLITKTKKEKSSKWPIKNIILLLLSFIVFVGCYFLFKHKFELIEHKKEENNEK